MKVSNRSTLWDIVYESNLRGSQCAMCLKVAIHMQYGYSSFAFYITITEESLDILSHLLECVHDVNKWFGSRGCGYSVVYLEFWCTRTPKIFMLHEFFVSLKYYPAAPDLNPRIIVWNQVSNSEFQLTHLESISLSNDLLAMTLQC